MTSQEEEINLLKQENTKLKEQLEKYSHSQREYYEKNKELVIQKANERKELLKETNPEKIKEYARRAYLKRKEKLKKETKNEIVENV